MNRSEKYLEKCFQQTKPCERCGEIFRRLPNHSAAQWIGKRFCSIRCGRLRHGSSRRPKPSLEYVCWQGMKARCHNPTDPNFNQYGERGISVCDRWRNSFENFLADMGPKPTPSHTVDRIDGTRGYEPENCRWATRCEQRLNQKRIRLINLDGELLPLAVAARKRGLVINTVRARLSRGWSVERAFS